MLWTCGESRLLSLSDCELSGTLPFSIGSLTNLTYHTLAMKFGMHKLGQG